MKRHASAAAAVSLFAFRRRVAPSVSVLTFAAFLFTLVPPHIRRAEAAPPVPTAPDSPTNQAPGNGPSSPNTTAPANASGVGDAVILPVSPTGAFAYNYPFQLLHARGGVQPSLTLSYSSNKKWGEEGVGWDLHLMSITRTALPGMTANGQPLDADAPPIKRKAAMIPHDRFTTDAGDELELVCTISGSTCTGAALPQGEVMPSWSNGWLYYRPRVETSFDRYFLSADYQTWRVQIKDSSIDVELGRTSNNVGKPKNGDDPASAIIFDSAKNYPVRWSIVRAFDGVRGARDSAAPTPVNQVLYRYMRDASKTYNNTWDGPLYLSDIYSTSPVLNSTSTDTAGFAQHVRLVYEARLDTMPMIGWGKRLADFAKRLKRVDVSSKPYGSSSADRELVRRYHLSYIPDSPKRTDRLSYLSSIQLEGRCADSVKEDKSESLPTVSNCPTLPRTQFQYDATAGSVEKPNPLSTIGPLLEQTRLKVGDQVIHWVDVNGDGLIDVLAASTAVYGKGQGVFLNGLKGTPGEFTAAFVGFKGLPAFPEDTADSVAPGRPGVFLGDFDGNGTLDLLVAPTAKTARMYSLHGEGANWGWEGEAISSGLSIPLSDVANVRVADVDGDGTSDIVVTTEKDVETFFSLGRYPGGAGRFGSVGDSIDNNLILLDDPVRSPLPKLADGDSLLLARSDVRIADLNGDHLPDLVQLAKDGIHVWSGSGGGVFGQLADKEYGSVAEDAVYALGPEFRPDATTSMRLGDVSGDGRDDLVVVSSGVANVWLNDGAGAFAPPASVPNVPAGAPTASLFKLASVRGLGRLELVWDFGGRVTVSQVISGDALLHRISNGYGGTHDMGYTRMTGAELAARSGSGGLVGKTPSSGLPDITYVTSITTSDNRDLVGGTKSVSTTHLAYDAPYVNPNDRSFVGFGTVTQSFDGDASRAGESIRTQYNLGACVDDVSTIVKECDDKLELNGNPRAPLRMTPRLVERFDASGSYLSTTHYTYRLRQLYPVGHSWTMHAYAERVDAFRYDTSAGQTTDTGTRKLDDVRFEAPNATESSAVPVRSAKAVATATETEIDALGNVSKTTKLGRPGVDEAITNQTAWQRPADDVTGWTYRARRRWALGSSAPSILTNDLTTDFDSMGRPTKVTAVLSGVRGVQRFREPVAGESPVTPPAAPSASTNGTITLFSVSYDPVGNVSGMVSPNNRCAKVDFDSVYGQLPNDSTNYAGSIATPVQGLGMCGNVRITSFAAHDRGLERMTQAWGHNFEKSQWDYDGFGRLIRYYAPQTSTDPEQLGKVAADPSIKISYDIQENIPLARMLMQTLFVGADGASSYRNFWTLTDGLQRSIATFSQADPSARGGDEAAWIVAGVVDRNVRGDTVRSYLPWFSNVDPARAFASDVTPKSKATNVTLDAFGRTIDSFDVDGTRTSHRDYSDPLAVTAFDAEDLDTHSVHSGTPTTVNYDGHGRAVTSRAYAREAGALRETDTIWSYDHDGNVLQVQQAHPSTGDTSVVRTMAYDSLGRLVENFEPNTSFRVSSDLVRAWRYAYNDNGDLVATSDSRGCGQNIFYDFGGRRIGEDYWPCLASQGTWSPPDLTNGNGLETFNVYDSIPADVAQSPLAPDSYYAVGRIVATYDRGAETAYRYDGRGRTIGRARRLARPDITAANISERYSDHWFVQQTSYREDDRVAFSTTGADVPELLNSGVSAASPVYSMRGDVVGLESSYGTIVANIKRSAEGLEVKKTYGDAAATSTTSTYDERLRLHTVRTERVKAAGWSASPPTISPPPSSATTPLVLDSLEYGYDAVGNPRFIKDTRSATELTEWPAGSKPPSRAFEYDDKYRLTKSSTTYAGGSDVWRAPYAPELGSTPDDAKRDRAIPATAFATRPQTQTYAYDWLGNTTQTDDDAHGFFDRSLGTISNGTPADGPNQLRSASDGQGALAATYDASGNLTGLTVRRTSGCFPASAQCNQRFEYTWDEVGRMSTATRWDITPGTPIVASDPAPQPPQSLQRTGLTKLATTVPSTKDQETFATSVRYAYDASGYRVRKSVSLANGEQRHSLFVFDTLEVRRAQWFNLDNDYDITASTEVPRIGGIARVIYANAGLPLSSSGKRHVLLEIPSLLGSTGTVIDKETGELVEKKTFQPYGAAENDYRPDRWGNFREEVGFTGKEEDVEVGLIYFGARFLVPALGRWASPDPLAIHQFGGDPNPYAYVHGRVTAGTDPTGLDWASSIVNSAGDIELTGGVSGGGPNSSVDHSQCGKTEVCVFSHGTYLDDETLARREREDQAEKNRLLNAGDGGGGAGGSEIARRGKATADATAGVLHGLLDPTAENQHSWNRPYTRGFNAGQKIGTGALIGELLVGAAAGTVAALSGGAAGGTGVLAAVSVAALVGAGSALVVAGVALAVVGAIAIAASQSASDPEEVAEPTETVRTPPPAMTGTSGGTRAGKNFTAKGNKEIDAANAARNGGENYCDECDVKLVPGQQSKKGVTPPGNERQRDHFIPKSQGGDGDPSNGRCLCRDCNLDKSDTMPTPPSPPEPPSN